MESPNTKTYLLLQAHFSRLALPCSDYYTDLKSVLDQTIRILQAMIDVSAENGWLATTLQIINLMQMVLQARWSSQSTFLCLPHIEEHMLYVFRQKNLACIPQLWNLIDKGQSEPLAKILRAELEENQIDPLLEALNKLPKLQVDLSLAVDSNPPFLLRKRSSGKIIFFCLFPPFRIKHLFDDANTKS